MTNIINFPPLIELSPLSSPDAWEDPLIFDELHAPEIEARFLPGIFGEFAKALADSSETAESLSVMTVLGVLSVATSKYYRVSPKPGWEEPLNIYTIIALPPANNKSLVLSACTKPLIEWEREQSALLEGEVKRQRSERKCEERIIDAMRLKAAKERDSHLQKELIADIVKREASLTEPLIIPQLFVNDVTPESLAINAYEQGGAFALLSDEGGIIETLGGLYSNGTANIDILLKGIDGGTLRIRRKDRSLIINPFLTILLAVQPVIIRNLGNRKTFEGNGTLERFLYVLPKSSLGYRSHNAPSLSEATANLYSERIKNLLNLRAELQQKDQYKLLTLSKSAYEAWAEYQMMIEYQLRPNERLSGCLGWGGKICGFTLRIAGLLHVAEQGQLSSIISEQTMDNAIAIAYTLTSHALKAFNLMGLDETQEDAKNILEWIKGNGELQFTKSNVYQAMRNRKMRLRQRLNKALKLLAEHHFITPPQTLATKKPTTVYYVNPIVLPKREA